MSPIYRLNTAPVEEMAIDAPGESVALRAGAGVVLEEAEYASVVGRDYLSEADARAAGQRWRALLERAFARTRIGADFGDRTSPQYASAEWLEQCRREFKVERVLLDQPGLMVFDQDPWPLFIRFNADAFVGHPTPRVVKAIEAAEHLDLTLSEQERSAFDLYSASMFVSTNRDARFLMLMMALETIIEQRPKSAPSVAHVEALIALTCDAELPRDEAKSLIGSLQHMRHESISAAGRRVVEQLGERAYGVPPVSPKQFFTRCYKLRSDLVHGAHPRPSHTAVDMQTSGLETMVGDLLSGQLLDAFDLESWQPGDETLPQNPAAP